MKGKVIFMSLQEATQLYTQIQKQWKFKAAIILSDSRSLFLTFGPVEISSLTYQHTEICFQLH